MPSGSGYVARCVMRASARPGLWGWRRSARSPGRIVARTDDVLGAAFRLRRLWDLLRRASDFIARWQLHRPVPAALRPWLPAAMPTIDIHFHVVPPRFVDALRDGVLAEAVELDSSTGVDRMVFHAPPGVAVEPDTTLRPHVHDPRLVLAAMDRRGLDAAAFSPPPELLMYWAPPELGVRIARVMNDGMAELARAHPNRCCRSRRCRCRMVPRRRWSLNARCGSSDCAARAFAPMSTASTSDAPAVMPVLAMAERLDVPLFLHPQNAGDVTRLREHHLWNLIGFPMETATAAAKLIMSGCSNVSRG